VAGLILLILRFYRKPRMFTLMEGLVVLLATGFVLFAIFNTIFPSVNSAYLVVAAGVITMALIVAKNMLPRLRNLVAITSSIGVGVLIGFNGFYLAYFLMLLIAVYDYIAVFITKHMIAMAKEMSSRNLAFLISSTDVEAVPQRYMSRRDVSEFRKQEVKSKDPFIKGLVKDGIFPVVSQVQLGTGDLALPLMLAVSAYVSFLSYFAAVMVVLGAAFGMIFTMYLLKRYKVALPAIPPLFAFINLFLAVLFAINDFQAYKIWLGFFIIFTVTILALLNKLNGLRGGRNERL
jgi:presenilin-like A22 family membrane protease